MSIQETVNARKYLQQWNELLHQNFFDQDPLLAHSVCFCLGNQSKTIISQLQNLGEILAEQIETLVQENNERLNLPQLNLYNNIGELTNVIQHHPNYDLIGDAIYGTGLMEKFSQPGHMTESILLFYLSSHLGEAGHNCPVACTAGIIRVLQTVANFEGRGELLNKLCTPSFSENFTGAQFVTEIQGGSDVGKNSCRAQKVNDDIWIINGEKWFCSNANADLMLVSARYNEDVSGTEGLGLFLLKRSLDNGQPNGIKIRRLKEKLGTGSMASAEIDFIDAKAISMGPPQQGFKLLMRSVLHISRIFNSFAILGAAQRAYQIAFHYAYCRQAFGQPIIEYPLVQENLADIRCENFAMLTSALRTTCLQDQWDCEKKVASKQELLIRIRANLNKYFTAKLSVEHIHHCIDVLGGNGAIESFSSLPRLLRDAIVYENWEGTHNTLRLQILRDQHKYKILEILIADLKTQLVAIQHEYAEILNNQLSIVEKNCSSLMQESSQKQTLQVRDIIDYLCRIDCSIQLLEHAMDEKEKQLGTMKMSILTWLLIKYQWLSIEKYSDSWMTLLKTIITSSLQASDD